MFGNRPVHDDLISEFVVKFEKRLAIEAKHGSAPPWPSLKASLHAVIGTNWLGPVRGVRCENEGTLVGRYARDCVERDERGSVNTKSYRSRSIAASSRSRLGNGCSRRRADQKMAPDAEHSARSKRFTPPNFGQTGLAAGPDRQAPNAKRERP